MVLFIAALYGRTAAFDFSYLDDDILIVDDQAFLSAPNSLARAFTRGYFPFHGGAHQDHSYYRPLVTVSFVLDAAWGGTDAGVYHRTNVVLHAVATALLFLLLRRSGYRDLVALFGAFLFAAHPALTEAVAWIPGRNDVLLAVFALAAWLLLPRIRTSYLNDTAGQSQQARGVPTSSEQVFRLLAHQVAWLAALQVKETAWVLPVVWAVQLRWQSDRSQAPRASRLRLIWLAAGWLVTLAVYVIGRAALTSDGGGSASSDAGVPGLWAGLSVRYAVSNLPSLLGAIGKLVLPVHLSVLAIPADTWSWPGAVGVAALVMAARLIPGARRSHLLFGVGCLVLFLVPGLPASNLLVLENRLYLPAVGLVLVMCELFTALPFSTRIRSIVAVTLVELLATASFSYASGFRDRLAFAHAAVEQSPHSSLAHRNLGVAYHVAGDRDSARREYQAALAEDAGEPVAHNNLGVILMADGHLAEAEGELRQELTINPDYAPAHDNLAQVLAAVGRHDEAAGHWEKSLELNPRSTSALQALIDYYGPRDPVRASRLRVLLDSARSPTPPR
ncbi:MAG: tetratricopeptide repeat protein [Polyangia bacterium]